MLIARVTISRMNALFLRGCVPVLRSWFLVLRLADLRLPFGNSCRLRGRSNTSTGFTAWFGAIAIVAGVLLTLAGLVRYRQTRAQLESGTFTPAGFLIDLVAILVALAGVALAIYLIYIELRL